MNRLFIIGAGASIDHSGGLLPGTNNFLVKTREAARKSNDLDFYYDLDHEDIEWGQDEDGVSYPINREPLSEESETTQKYLAWLFGIWIETLGKPFSGSNWHDKKEKKHKQDQLLRRLKNVNVEELLTLAVIARQIDQSNPPEDHIINLIVNTIEYYSSQLDDPKSGVYEEFSDQLNPECDSIITFNWDTLLDQFFSKGYIPFSGSGGDLAGYYSKFFEICTAEKEAMWNSVAIKKPYVPSLDRKIGDTTTHFASHYIKLHGSINLVYCINGLCLNFQKPFLREGEFSSGNKCGVCHEAVKLYIIPPVQNKPIREMTYIRRSWNKAQELCSEADQVIFWGYSLPLTDHWTNWLVRNIWAGKCQEIIIVNPECIFEKSGKINNKFVNRFCPKEKFGNKEMRRLVFKDFKDYLNSNPNSV